MQFSCCLLRSLGFYFLVLHEVVAFDLYHDWVERGAVEHALQLLVGRVGLDLLHGLGPLLLGLRLGSVLGSRKKSQ